MPVSYTHLDVYKRQFDGQMGKHLVDPGNTVGGAGQQTALAEILQLDPIYVVANLSEQDVLKVRQNLGQRRLTFAEPVSYTHLDVYKRQSEPLAKSRNGCGFVTALITATC